VPWLSRNVFYVAFGALMLFYVAGTAYLIDMRGDARTRTIERERYEVEIKACERVQVIREELNDVIRTLRVVVDNPPEPQTEFGAQLQSQIAQLQVQEPVNCVAVTPAP
jgi:hypothetical protein